MFSGESALKTVTIAVLGGMLCFTSVGCASDSPQARSRVAPTLIGKSKQELVNCAGSPLKEIEQGDASVLIFYREAGLERAFMGSKSGIITSLKGCRARISLRNDRVEGIEYESIPEGVAGEPHCDEIFQSCSR